MNIRPYRVVWKDRYVTNQRFVLHFFSECTSKQYGTEDLSRKDKR